MVTKVMLSPKLKTMAYNQSFNQLALIIGIGLSLLGCQTAPTVSEEGQSPTISFQTSDSLNIYGDLYESDKSGTTILLFHQAGANARSEYASIIPRLQKEGYNVLAIDQRSGGQRFGGHNRTVAELANSRFGYCDVYPDLVGAVNYLSDNGYSGNKVIWGSSYSAALVIKLAHELPDEIDAVLAFSPASGNPMNDCKPEQYFETLAVPLLVLRPQREMDIESVQNQFTSAKGNGHQTYVANPGTHGSSMLVEERAGGDVSANWDVVLSFIESSVGKQPKAVH